MKLPYFRVSDAHRVSFSPDAPVATTARAAAAGRVSMSTRLDHERSGAVGIAHPETPSSPGSVDLHKLTH